MITAYQKWQAIYEQDVKQVYLSQLKEA